MNNIGEYLAPTCIGGAVGIIAGALIDRAGTPKVLAGISIFTAIGAVECWKDNDARLLAACGSGIATFVASRLVVAVNSKQSTASLPTWQSTTEIPATPVTPTINTTTSWLPIDLSGGNVAYAQGVHYRATASIDNSIATNQVQEWLSQNVWGNITVYDTTSTLPNDWPNEQLSNLEVNRRWVHVDATRVGVAGSMSTAPTVLFISIPVRVVNVWYAEVSQI